MLKDESWLHRVAYAVDSADIADDTVGLYASIRRCEALTRGACEAATLELRYFISNCWAAIARISHDTKDPWCWDQAARVNQAYYLRAILYSKVFPELSLVRQNQIRTNFANLMNTLGRTMTAIESWSAAIEKIPDFAAARGNRGIGLITMARHLPDVRDQVRLAEVALSDLQIAVSDGAFWDSGQKQDAAPVFEKYLTEVFQFLSLEHERTSSNRKSEEGLYRDWCRNEGLFLDPLNFAGYNIGCDDWVHLPPHTYHAQSTILNYVGYLNIIKSEYCFSRGLLFEADQHTGARYDANHLFDPFDGSIYGVEIEKYKLAVRFSYSIFDKIAIFMNEYWGCKNKVSQVTFKNIWYYNLKEKNGLRSTFVHSNNLPLRGLFFVSKDLFDREFMGVADPEAETLAKIRNRIEHRFLGVTEFQDAPQGNDSMAYVSIEGLSHHAFEAQRKAREAIILLCLAMHVEAYRRKLDARVKSGPGLTIEEPARPANRLSSS